jgi:hypothetical protein
MAPLVGQDLEEDMEEDREEDLEEDMEVDTIMEEVLEVLEANTLEVGLVKVLVMLMVQRVANKVAVTKRKTTKRVVETNTKQLINQAVDRRETKVIRFTRHTIKAMLGKKVARCRKDTTTTRRVRRKVITMKLKSTANITKGQRDIRVPAMVRRVAIRRDTRRPVTITCFIRTNSRRNTPSTMMPTRVGMTVNTASSKKSSQLQREATKREVILMLLIIQVNTERRGCMRRDSTTASRRDTKARKGLKVIMIITRIMPRRVATVKDLLTDTAVVKVMVEAMVAVMVASMAVAMATKLQQHWIFKSVQANTFKFALLNKTCFLLSCLACCNDKLLTQLCTPLQAKELFPFDRYSIVQSHSVNYC